MPDIKLLNDWRKILKVFISWSEERSKAVAN